MSKSSVLFCVSNDPWGEPRGGQANFAKQILYAFGDRIIVASTTTEDLPLRKWCDRQFEHYNIKFLNMGKIISKDSCKPIIPLRYRVYMFAKLSMPQIYDFGIKNIFIDTPEMLFAAVNYKWENVCYRFAGVNNPIEYSRYRWAKLFSKVFEKKIFCNLKKINVNVILVSADYKAIDEIIVRSRGILDQRLFYHFPTRVDTNKFRSISKNLAREMLNIKNDNYIIVSCGRLSKIKGWDLILNALEILKRRGFNFQLIFVGDGEDRQKVEKKAQMLGIKESVKITGFIPHGKVNIYLNAADLCVVASNREGWSLAMLEIIACGKPIVSTNVSGAKDLIIQGVNGFIVERNPRYLADAIVKTFKLNNVEKINKRIVAQYSTTTLATDLASIWTPLSLSNENGTEGI